MSKQRRTRIENSFLKRRFGAYVRGKRRLAEWSQDVLAKKLKIEQTMVARMELGKVPIDSIPFTELAVLFGVSKEEILCTMVGLDYPNQIGGKNILPVLQAISTSETEKLTLSQLFVLLRAEINLNSMGLTVTKESVLALLSRRAKS